MRRCFRARRINTVCVRVHSCAQENAQTVDPKMCLVIMEWEVEDPRQHDLRGSEPMAIAPGLSEIRLLDWLCNFYPDDVSRISQ